MPNEVFNIDKCLESLKDKRELFHSEADFQFALGWEIQNLYPDAKIRFEYPLVVDLETKNSYVDIFIQYNLQSIFLELKYKTVALEVKNKNENFKLKNQGAQDLGRYDFLKDIERLENIINCSTRTGYTIWLTNDISYIKSPKKETVIYKNFSVENNTVKSGILSWNGNPSAGTIKNREKAINLRGIYHIHWKKFSDLREEKKGSFYYSINKICVA